MATVEHERPLRRARNPRSRRARGRSVRAAARRDRARADRAGLGEAAGGRRSEAGHLARGACEAAAAAQVRSGQRCSATRRRSAVSTSSRPATPSGCTCRPGRSSSRRATPALRRAARALFAAGFRPGDIVHNSFAYHLTPGAFILEEGAHALGCAVIPGGVGNTEQQIEAIAHLKPAGYIGTPDFLKVLLDTAAKAGKDVVVDQARAGFRRGAAGLAAARSWRPRRRGAAMLRHRRDRRDRLRERGARRHDRQRDR